MNFRGASLFWIALGVLCLFIPIPPGAGRTAAILPLVGCAVFCSTGLILWLIQRFKRDKYDLNELRELVIGGTYEESEVPDADDDGDKYCMYCHTVYGVQFGVCPKCGR